ncbi:hypothetical protein DFJ73DRAFT_594 [Zopfochytrium polystomum]|nr:hypothetical protein DFJ73DRAFT_594 [Zopfochytrium polystomum]
MFTKCAMRCMCQPSPRHWAASSSWRVQFRHLRGRNGSIPIDGRLKKNALIKEGFQFLAQFLSSVHFAERNDHLLPRALSRLTYSRLPLVPTLALAVLKSTTNLFIKSSGSTSAPVTLHPPSNRRRVTTVSEKSSTYNPLLTWHTYCPAAP